MRIPIVNLDAAAKIGPLINLLPLEADLRPDLIGASIHLTRRALDEVWRPDDWLVCIGDPIIQATAIHWIATRSGGVVRLLRWGAGRREYDAYEGHIDV